VKGEIDEPRQSVRKRLKEIEFVFFAVGSLDSLLDPLWPSQDKGTFPMLHQMVWLLDVGHRYSRKLGFISQNSAKFLGDLPVFAVAIIMLPTLVLAMLVHYFRSKLTRGPVSSSPGSFLSRLADFLCSKKTKREIADPIISDMQFEYYEALFAHRKAKAGWIRVRGCCAFFHALGLHRILKGVAGLFQQARPR
jgi:hypothetical protein